MYRFALLALLVSGAALAEPDPVADLDEDSVEQLQVLPSVPEWWPVAVVPTERGLEVAAHASLPEPLEAAGIGAGARLERVDGVQVDTLTSFVSRLRASTDGTWRLGFVVLPEGEEEEVVRGGKRISEYVLEQGEEIDVEVEHPAWGSASRIALLELPPVTMPLSWSVGPGGALWLDDGAGRVFAIDDEGRLVIEERQVERWPTTLPHGLWHLGETEAWWLEDGSSAPELITVEEIGARFAVGAVTDRFRGEPGTFAVRPEESEDGLRLSVYELAFASPRQLLPQCAPDLPQACIATGLAWEEHVPHYRDAAGFAAEQYSRSCDEGIVHGCYLEASLAQDDALATAARACLGGDFESCGSTGDEMLGRGRLDAALGIFTELCLHGFAERCYQATRIFDGLERKADALIMLERGCVAGDAEACAEADQRRAHRAGLRAIESCVSSSPDGEACVVMGDLLEDGSIRTASIDAFQAYQRGCAAGAEQGCEALDRYVLRWGVDNERVRGAQDEFRASCDEGNPVGCYGAGMLLYRYNPKEPQYSESYRRLVTACRAEHAPSCLEASALSTRRVDPEQRVLAGELLLEACQLGSGEGCRRLAEAYEARSSTRAVAWEAWARGCELGDAESCLGAAGWADRKRPPEGAPDDGRPFLVIGCGLGDGRSCHELGWRERGKDKGMLPDATAYVHYDASCSEGYGLGCREVAESHERRGTDFDQTVATVHYHQACDKGDYESCLTASVRYKRGLGVERDRSLARDLRDRALRKAQRRYLRITAKAAVPQLVGGELEALLPIPYLPAIGVFGEASRVPGLSLGDLGDALGVEEEQRLDFTYTGVGGRLYATHSGRGLYLAGGLHWITTAATGGFDEWTDRIGGFNARIGVRSESRGLITGVEFGLGTYPDPELEADLPIPLLLPFLGLSVGYAPF